MLQVGMAEKEYQKATSTRSNTSYSMPILQA